MTFVCESGRCAKRFLTLLQDGLFSARELERVQFNDLPLCSILIQAAGAERGRHQPWRPPGRAADAGRGQGGPGAGGGPARPRGEGVQRGVPRRGQGLFRSVMRIYRNSLNVKWISGFLLHYKRCIPPVRTVARLVKVQVILKWAGIEKYTIVLYS